MPSFLKSQLLPKDDVCLTLNLNSLTYYYFCFPFRPLRLLRMATFPRFVSSSKFWKLLSLFNRKPKSPDMQNRFQIGPKSLLSVVQANLVELRILNVKIASSEKTMRDCLAIINCYSLTIIYIAYFIFCVDDISRYFLIQ